MSENHIIKSNVNQSTIPEISMRKSCVCVIRCYTASSLPLDDKVPETKTKIDSTKLSEFPHHTTYHTITKHTYCYAILGCPTYPVRPFWGADMSVSSHYGVLTYPCQAILGANLPMLSHSGVLTYPSVLTTELRGLFHTLLLLSRIS